MIKRLPSRNQRSKRITVKHILQICLLLGVCFWLAYQVKRSHDKKREFEEKDANALVKTQIGDQILKLGRKDLNPHVGGITKNHKNDDEEEDELVIEDEENKHEEGQEEDNKREEIQDKGNKQEGEDQGEDENKHEVEDQDDEDNRSDETEDEGKGGGDEEIDESDQEKSEAEIDRDEEFVDGEKEKEESDDRENEKGGDDKESLVENQNTHEAREENYKADDASSAVAHDTQITEKESGKVERSIEDEDMSILERDNKQNSAEDGTRDNSDTNIISQMAVTASLKETTGAENASVPDSFKPANTSTSIAMSAINHLEADSSVTDSTEVGNNTSKGTTWLNRTTGAGHNTSTTQTYVDSSGSSLQNGVEKISESDFVQNPTVNGSVTGASEVMQFQKLSQANNTVSRETRSNANPATTGSAENNVTAGENSIGLETETESVKRSEATEEAEKNSRTSDTRENNGTTEAESEGNIQSSNTDEALSSSKTGTLDAAQHDPIDTSDSDVHQEVAQARTDIDTLPDVRTRADTSDETATE